MAEIIIPGQKNPHDPDMDKDCPDFVPLKDEHLMATKNIVICRLNVSK